jgi:hypothetical protein
MEITKRSREHANAVAEFWNAKAQDPNSWWQFSAGRPRTVLLNPVENFVVFRLPAI